MAKTGENCPCFFRVILSTILQNGTLELPISFVKEHEKRLSKHARLKVPTGAESKMKLKRCSGRAWLHQGWQDFVDKYSIQCGYFLVFRYQGGSLFYVQIFNRTTREIEYPRMSHKLKEEDSDEDDQSPQEVEKGRDGGTRSARAGVIQRAKAFWSPNLHFVVIMHQTYKSYLNVPVGPANRRLLEKGKSWISLEGGDGRSWCVKCTIATPPRHRVRFFSGWSAFWQENLLEEGDGCAFELVKSTPMTFRVTILRAADQVVRNETLVMLDKKPSARANKGGCSDAMDKRSPR